MKYILTFEKFGEYLPLPFDLNNSKITDFSQQTPNGMSGTSIENNDLVKSDDLVDDQVKRLARDIEPEINRKRRRKLKKIKTFQSKNNI